MDLDEELPGLDHNSIEILGGLAIAAQLQADFGAGVGGRQDLRYKAEVFGVEIIAGDARLDDHVWLRLKIPHVRIPNASVEISKQVKPPRFKGRVEKVAKIV